MNAKKKKKIINDLIEFGGRNVINYSSLWAEIFTVYKAFLKKARGTNAKHMRDSSVKQKTDADKIYEGKEAKKTVKWKRKWEKNLWTGSCRLRKRQKWIGAIEIPVKSNFSTRIAR